jgi:hypothetical protein
MSYVQLSRMGWVVVFVASYFSSTDVSTSYVQLTIVRAGGAGRGLDGAHLRAVRRRGPWDLPPKFCMAEAHERTYDAFGLIWFQKNWIIRNFQSKYMIRNQISPNA